MIQTLFAEPLEATVDSGRLPDALRSRLHGLASDVRTLIPDAEIVLTGAWLWVTGSDSTYTARAELKTLGFKWAKNKQKWYFAGRPAMNRRTMGWEYITAQYGTEEL